MSDCPSLSFFSFNSFAFAWDRRKEKEKEGEGEAGRKEAKSRGVVLLFYRIIFVWDSVVCGVAWWKSFRVQDGRAEYVVR